MNSKKPTIGLLPLYLKLYDDALPECRPGCEQIWRAVRDGLANRGATVISPRVCRVAAEVEAAVQEMETAGADCLVTLHLAYSPSRESVPALTRSKLPLIILDTTIDPAFGPDTDPAKIMFNHGVHGVMDLASVLRREGRVFEIVAGHVTESDVLDRTADLARAALAARRFRQMRAVRIGHEFAGMGDFAVDPAVLREAFGIHVDHVGTDAIAREMKSVTAAEIDEELARDRQRFVVQADPAVHRRSVHTGLALRRFLESGGYGAFSANFQAFTDPAGPVMPFLEISKAMSRGTGFGGEGDVLTASLVGALAQGFGNTTFTEIFCADWRGNSLFLSHMGEINPDLAPDKPLLVVKDYPFVPAGPTAALVCGIRPGPAVFVNLVPGPQNRFELLVAPVEMLADTNREDLRQSVRGWMRPTELSVAGFLERYSSHGGTHHSALVLGAKAEAVRAFARWLGLMRWTI